MKLRRITSLFLALIMIFSLTACSGGKTPDGSGGSGYSGGSSNKTTEAVQQEKEHKSSNTAKEDDAIRVSAKKDSDGNVVLGEVTLTKPEMNEFEAEYEEYEVSAEASDDKISIHADKVLATSYSLRH